MQGENKEENVMGVMNVENISILGTSLDKMDNGSVKIEQNKGLEKVPLIQHKIIS